MISSVGYPSVAPEKLPGPHAIVFRLVKTALILLLALLLLAGIAVGILFGLASSEAGTRWLAAQAENWAGDMVQWQDIGGSLFGPLQLQSVRISQPGLNVQIQSVDVDWQPAALLQGQLQINSLTIQGVRVSLSTSPPQATTEPFDPSTIQLPVDVLLHEIRLLQLQIVQGDQPALFVNELKLDAQLKNGEVAIEQMAINLAGGGLLLSGSTAHGNPMPLDLKLGWYWRLAKGVASASVSKQDVPLEGSVALQGKLHWGETIGFQLQYEADAEGLRQLSLELPTQLNASGELRGQYHDDELTLEQLSIALAEMTLGLEGAVLLGQAAEPSFNLAMLWTELQWPLITNDPEISSTKGKLLLEGNTSAYEFALATELAGAELPASQWSGVGRGDLSRVELDQLQGVLLGGELLISGPVEWSPIPHWQLQLAGNGLDPGQFTPDLSGHLNINARSSGQLDPLQGLQASIDIEKLEGTLLGYALNIKAQASLMGDEVQLDSLLIESKGNQITASGLLSAEALALEWQLRASAPGELLAGASGTLTGSGKVIGNPNAPLVQARFSGQDLRWEDFGIATLDASLSAGKEAEDKLRLDVALGSLEQGEQVLFQSLRMMARGTTSQHSLNIDLDTSNEKLYARLEGGLNNTLDAWQGRLTQLEGHSEDYGRWRLTAPSALSLAPANVVLGSSCFKHESSTTSLCAMGSVAESGVAELGIELQAMPIDLLSPTVTGELAGKLEVGLARGGALSADANFSLTPGLVKVELEQGAELLSHGGGTFKLNIDGNGLNSKIDIVAPEQGRVEASALLPAFTMWPLPEKQPLRGKLTASLPSLSGLARWVPEISSSSGNLDADFQLGGTLNQPQLLGQLALSNGAVDIPAAGLQLRNIELHARSNESRSGLLELAGGMESGPGSIDLSGQLDMADHTMAVELKGERLQVFNTQDAEVVISPNLQIAWSDEILKLRGQIQVPRADITPQLNMSPSVASQGMDIAELPGDIIGPSPDVVLLNAPQELSEVGGSPSVPFRLDSQIELILGDRVKVNTLGFISQITGAVTFSNTPEQRDFIPMAKGRLSLDDGTFRAFGQDLVIETGRLIFADVPATEPELNVRAVRWIDSDPNVTAAGVLVTGSVAEPNLELFSRPQLDASEIQSYLLTGRSSDDKSDVLSIGTYVSRRVYVGYGYNLIQNTNEFNSLFTITPRYGVGANLGEADNNVNVTITHEN